MNKVTVLRVVVRARYALAWLIYCDNPYSRMTEWLWHPRRAIRTRQLIRLWRIGRHAIEA